MNGTENALSSTQTLADYLTERFDQDADAPCPHHGIHDCSPLLNGCSLVARQQLEVEAKRDILREHVGYGGICGTCGVRKPKTGERWPCRTLRLLGWPYSNRVDYRSEWRP